MILRYIYTDRLYDNDKVVNLNLGGPYRFNYKQDDHSIEISRSNSYVSNLYTEYNNILDVSAVIGKNSTGKTSILKIINRILHTDQSKRNYIAIFQAKTGWSVYSNIEIRDFTGEQIPIKEKVPGEHNIISKINQKYKIVYFSNIFDKSTPMSQDVNLIDISTNHLLTKFLKYYKENYRKSKSCGPIEIFKEKENMDKMEFLISVYNNFQDKKEHNLLFDFPEYIDISFSDDAEMKEQLYKDIEDVDEILKEQISMLDTVINDYYDRDGKDSKDEFIYEFIILLSYEILAQLCLDGVSNTVFGIEYIVDAIKEGKEISLESLQTVIEHNVPIKNSEINKIISTNKAKKTKVTNPYFNCIAVLDELKSLFKREFVIEYINENDSIDEFKRKYDSIVNDLLDLINDYEVDIRNTIKETIDEIKEYFNNLFLDFDNIYIVEGVILSSEENFEDYLDLIEDIIDKSIGYLLSIPIEKNRPITEVDISTYYDSYVLEEKHKKLFNDANYVLKQLFDIIENENTSFHEAYSVPELRIDTKNSKLIEFINSLNKLSLKANIIVYDHIDLSTGHNAYLDMCARIYSLKSKLSVQGCNTILLLIDEGELFLHPEIQLKYIDNLLCILNTLFQEIKFQIIFTSNSPFIISDIQNSNIVYLKEGNDFPICEYDKYQKTFGADVNSLLLNNFILSEGIIGSFAKKQINQVIDQLNELRQTKEQINNNERLKRIKEIINIIGDPLIQTKLDLMYCNLVTKNMDDQLAYHRREIERLEKIKKEHYND